MNVLVIGCGYVGSVVAAGLAYIGHDVVATDASPGVLERFLRSTGPAPEPGLDPLIRDGREAGRLSFVGGARRAAPAADVVVLCVGTPEGHEGRPDLSQVETAVASIAPLMSPGATLVSKSTLPVGAAEWLAESIERHAPEIAGSVGLVSNPEFLREGTAVDDFLAPDRIVVGGCRPSPACCPRSGRITASAPPSCSPVSVGEAHACRRTRRPCWRPGATQASMRSCWARLAT